MSVETPATAPHSAAPAVGVACLLLAVFFPGPASVVAQSVEIDVGWSMIDHDPPANATYSGEQLPGMANLNLRVGATWYGQMDLGYGVGPDFGSVQYRVAVFGLGAGRHFRARTGSIVWGWRPTLGLTLVDDGRNPSKWFGSFSFTGEVGYDEPFALPAVVSIVAGLGRVETLIRTSCEDCVGPLLADALPRYSLGIGVRRSR